MSESITDADKHRIRGEERIRCAAVCLNIERRRRRTQADAIASFGSSSAYGREMHEAAETALRCAREIQTLGVTVQGATRNPDVDIEGATRAAFDAYNVSKGGLTYDGKPIPPWSVIQERTPDVCEAWRAAVRAAIRFANLDTGGDFGYAVNLVRNGRRARRNAWGEGQWIHVHMAHDGDPSRTPSPAVESHLELFTPPTTTEGDGWVVPWVPTQADMLATDWRDAGGTR